MSIDHGLFPELKNNGSQQHPLRFGPSPYPDMKKVLAQLAELKEQQQQQLKQVLEKKFKPQVELERKLEETLHQKLEKKFEVLKQELAGGIAATGDVLAPVAEVVADAHRIVDLPDDWDGEGGLGCTQETWELAQDTVLAHTRRLWECHGKVVVPFRIIPDLEGGIDVHWRCLPFELLLNVPANPAEPITFFGNNRDRHTTCKTSGELLPGETVNLGVIAWLAQMT